MKSTSKAILVILGVWTFIALMALLVGVILKTTNSVYGPITPNYLFIVGGLALGITLCVLAIVWLFGGFKKSNSNIEEN